MINVELRTRKEPSEEFKKEVEVYNKALEEAERMGIPCTMKEPKMNSDFKYVTAAINNHVLKNELSHYTVNEIEDDTISLCYMDGHAMVIKYSREVIDELNKL